MQHRVISAIFYFTLQESLAKLLDSEHEEHEQPEETNETTENNESSKFF